MRAVNATPTDVPNPMAFHFTRLELAGVVLVERNAIRDERGLFEETYRASEFGAFGIDAVFRQDAHSQSQKGVLRGLHYQKSPMAQGKLVWVAAGRIFDVAVDVRRASRSYGKWVAVELAADNGRCLYIPPGFAHGFYTLSETADIMYKMTQEYSPLHERGIIWNDPELAIAWPGTHPTISPRAAAFPPLRNADIETDPAMI